MADSNFTIKVNVADGGDIEKIKRALAGLGATVDTSRKRLTAAERAAADFTRTQNQGVAGIANSTRSFSKLAETIGRGGSSGLVGAYATLAANIFAVTAGFNALRSASQVEQIFRGLEASGARTGLSLNSTAKALVEVTGAAISAEQAMRSTAQITSAGFSGETVERLGKAARDASFALGRNMTDSLDRLSRGVVKLEPELLDELGIMTKLTESNVRYAQQLGKTESQLSNFEKRQGFLNAVIAEAELKFGGLADSAGDSTAYDRLAASFSNLTTSILNTVNVVAKPFASALAGSSTLILGILISFAATLKSQLLPGLAASATASAKAAAALRQLATEKLEAVQAARQLAAAEQAQLMTTRQSFNYLGNAGARVYRQHRDDIIATIGSTQELTREQSKGINSLRSSIRANQAILENRADFAKGTDKGDAKRAEQAGLLRELRAVEQLRRARQDAANFDVEAQERVSTARREAAAASKLASSQEASAASIGAASQLKMVEAWKQMRVSVADYAASQAIASNAGVTGMGKLRTAIFATTAGARVLGTAFLTILPYLGLIVTAVGLVASAWNSLKSDAVKDLEKATESFNEVAQKAVQYGNEIARANKSQVDSSIRTAAALNIQSNAIREATEKYNEYLSAQSRVDREGAFINILKGLTGDNKTDKTVATFWESFFDKGSDLSYRLDIRRGTNALKAAEAATGAMAPSEEIQKAAQMLNTLEESAPKELNKWVEKSYGSWQVLNAQIARNPKLLADVAKAAATDLNNALGQGSERLKSFQEAMKQLETDLASFYRSAAMSTPFDAVVKSATNANNTIRALADTYKGSGDQWKNVLTGLDANTSSTLSVNLQKDIQAYKQADTIVQSLNAKAAELAQKTDDRTRKQLELTQSQKTELEQKTAIVAQAGKLGDRIMAELEATESIFLKAQETTRQYQSQLSLLQAQISANGNIYKAGAAGLRAKLQDEDRVRDIQKGQLKVQIDILKGSIALNESKAAGLRNSIQQNEQLLEQIRLTSVLNLEQQKANLAARGVSSESLTQLQNRGWSSNQTDLLGLNLDKSTKDALDGYLRDVKAIDEATKSQVQQRMELRAAEQASRDIQASIRSLSTQIAAIDASRLTAAEKAAAYQRAELEFRSASLTALRAQEKALVEINGIYREIDATVNGTSGLLATQIELLKKSTLDQKKALRDEYVDKRRELDTQLREAKAQKSRPGLTTEQKQAADALVRSAEDAIKIAEQGLNIDLGRLDAQTKLNIVQKVYFDTAKEGLEWQKTSLDYVQKELDTYRALSEEAQKNFELRVKLRAAQRGVQVTETGQQALDINAARMTYKLAVEESSIKKALIDLEFALLEAQRDQLASELRARRDNIDKNDTVRIAQLDATLARIEGIDLSKVADASKRVIDSSVENARLALQTVLTPKGREGPFGAITAAVEDFKLLQKQRAEAARDDFKPIQVTKIVGAETVAQKMARAIETSTDPVVVSNVKLAQKIDEAIKVIEKSIGTTRPELPALTDGGTQAVSIGKNVGARVKEALEFFMSKGYTLNQSAGLVGNLQQESGLDPTSRNRSSGAYGIAQWLSKGRIQEFVKKFGHSLQESTFREQLEFIVHELNTTEKAAGRALRATTTLEQATSVVRKKYERPGEAESNDTRRIRFAKASVNVRAEPQVSAIPSRAAEEVLPARRRQKPTLYDNPIDIMGPGNTGGRSYEELSMMPQGSLEPQGDLTSMSSDVFDKLSKKVEFTGVKEALNLLDSMTAKTLEQLGELGPEGEIIQTMYAGMTGMTYSIVTAMETMNSVTGDTAEGFAKRFSAIAAVAQQTVGMIQGILAANTRAKEELIDREIAAEQRRDGKSAESVTKIAAMEKRKDEIARKQFNTNKKLMMAQAVISTATGVASALAIPFIGIPLAAAIAALGAAQIAIIAGTSYQSSATNAATNFTTPTLTIGKRGDNVDLAKQNNNVGGELGYLRGRQGTGSNSSNYSVIGSAYGGELPRGYGNTSYVVGEKGPETIEVTPERAMSVRPANATPVEAGRPIEAHISIQALDGASVESVIRDQRGNIISMLREAANANGTPFMEDVNVQVYSSPNKGRKI